MFYHYLLYGWIILGVVVMFVLLFYRAPYGRYASKKWGVSLEEKISWILMEFPAIAVFSSLFLLGEKNIVNTVFFTLWFFHYFYRTFVYPLFLPKGAKKVPISIIIFAWIFNITNSYLNGYYLFFIAPRNYNLDWLFSLQFIIGLILFSLGFYIHSRSDLTLLKLKRESGGRYLIPQGWLFNLISCPNYLGETIEWLGWALLTLSLPGFAFLFWTIANLWPRALSHHRWYREKFPDYPRERRAIIPFVL